MNTPRAWPHGSAPVSFGVIGARSMIATRAVLPTLAASQRCRLVAVAASHGPVADPWIRHDVGTYEAVLGHPDVEAVYIPLPNGMHEEWVERAVAAGKHVLCEKPLAPDAAGAERMRLVAETGGVVLAEAWMTPFDPRWTALMALARSGRLGEITTVDATFTFTLPPQDTSNYRWDPDQGGGALLDVGIYCLGPAIELWDAAPDAVDVTATMTALGVDAADDVRLTWADGRVATARCSFIDDDSQRLTIGGAAGAATLDDDAHTGGSAARRIALTDRAGRPSGSIEVAPGDPHAADPYEGMVDAFAAAVRGIEPWPRPVARSVELLELLDRIRREANRSADL